jgi:hypothetical protein
MPGAVFYCPQRAPIFRKCRSRDAGGMPGMSLSMSACLSSGVGASAMRRPGLAGAQHDRNQKEHGLHGSRHRMMHF